MKPKGGSLKDNTIDVPLVRLTNIKREKTEITKSRMKK